MELLAGGITHGQAVALLFLCIFLIVFIIWNIYLVLFLHRRNKKLAQSKETDKRLNDVNVNSTADE